MQQSKPCKKCGQVKTLSEFHRNSNISDGHKNSCKKCESDYYKLYRAAKPRVLTEDHKQKQRNRLKKLRQTPEWKAKKAEWYQNNKAKVREQTKQYRAKRPGLNAAYVRKYEAKRRGNGIYEITHKEIIRLRQSPCFYCGSIQEKITLDHVIPIKQGGRHSIGNIVAACQSCNSSKQDKFIMEWKIQRGKNER